MAEKAVKKLYPRQHVYHNAQGEAVAVKTVYKTADGKKNCKWQTITPTRFLNYLTEEVKAQIPLYNIPRLLATVSEEQPLTEQPLFFVEGEKDTETLAKMGYIATTTRNGGGSFPKWDKLEPFISHFNGFVFVLADNDETGKTYGVNAVKCFTRHFCEVYVIDTIDIFEAIPLSERSQSVLEPHADISDIVALFGLEVAKNALKQCINARCRFGNTNPIYNPEPPTEPKQKVIEAYNKDFLEIINISELEPLEHSMKFVDYFAVYHSLRAVDITLNLNIMNQQIELSGNENNIARLADNPIQSLSNAIRWLLQKFGYKRPSVSEITETLTLIAEQNQYHPVREILESIVWDGKDRLPYFCQIAGINDTLQQNFLKKWLIQSVAMLYNDKNHALQAEGVIVLQGVEGLGKTTFLEKLAIRPCFFQKSATIDMMIKDTQIKALSAWITEIGELDSTTRKNQSDLKGFITETYDNIRRPYARESIRNPRRTSFCGSVNPEHFLHEENGYRRWWTIPIQNMDIKAILAVTEEEIIQLYAQMRLLFIQDNASFRLNKDELAQLRSSNAEYAVLLNGEAEIYDSLDFSLPKEDWLAYTYADISKILLDRYGVRVNSTYIGRIITKIERSLGVTFEKFQPHGQSRQTILPIKIS